MVIVGVDERFLVSIPMLTLGPAIATLTTGETRWLRNQPQTPEVNEDLPRIMTTLVRINAKAGKALRMLVKKCWGPKCLGSELACMRFVDTSL